MNPKCPILLIDDDYVDVKTVEKAIMDAEINHELVVAGNGDEALNWLRENKGKDPCLIFLDINMPIMNGIEFLTEIKSNEKFKTIPVLVLATSEHEKDKNIAFEKNAAAYMVKPWNYHELVDMFKSIKEYWGLQ